jgi:hypothetical protein
MAMFGEAVVIRAVVGVNSPDALSFLVNPLIWAAVGFLAGIYFFVRGFALLRRKRSIQDVPRCTIRSAPLGLVEVSGKVEGPYTIIAPLSEEECFYYRSIVWCKGERSSWRKAAEESLAAPFFLGDGTGKIMVDPRQAETDLPPVFSEEYESDTPDRLRHFLSRHAISPGSPVKLEEYCVRSNDTLFVMGSLGENHSSASATGRCEDGFLSEEAADLQRRGEIDADLPVGAVAIEAKPVRVSEPSSEFDLHPPVALAASQNHPLYLSNRSRSEILQTLALQSALGIWGGPLLSLTCFWYLLSRLRYL